MVIGGSVGVSDFGKITAEPVAKSILESIPLRKRFTPVEIPPSPAPPPADDRDAAGFQTYFWPLYIEDCMGKFLFLCPVKVASTRTEGMVISAPSSPERFRVWGRVFRVPKFKALPDALEHTRTD